MPQVGCDNELMAPGGPATERSASKRAARGALLFVLGVCQLASVSCGDAPAPPEPAGNVTPTEHAAAGDSGPWYLRLRNDTELDLESVTVEESLEYGALPAGEHSEYLPMESLYGTALIEAVSGEFRVMYVPVDHVGERLAPPGHYTYALHPAPASWLTDGFADVKWVRIELLDDVAPE